MTLRDDILNNPECAQAVTDKNCSLIATLLPPKKVKNSAEIGNGYILEILGIETGNIILDILLDESPTSDFRHTKPLIQQGRLLINSETVQRVIDTFVQMGKLTQEQSDNLKAIGYDLIPYSPQEIAEALFNPDGSLK